jgi:hypothetical protein
MNTYGYVSSDKDLTKAGKLIAGIKMRVKEINPSG